MNSVLARLSLVLALAAHGQQTLYVANNFGNTISRVTPTGAVSTFATGLNGPSFLAFAPVPEPSAFVPLGLGALALLRRRKK